MSNTRYRRGGMYAADMSVYSKLLSEENTNEGELNALQRKLAMALRQDVTPTQRKYLRLYYVEGLNMIQIGELMGVDKSTVSRTIQRGEARLRRCLRYGAANLLDQSGINVPYKAVVRHSKREGYENC